METGVSIRDVHAYVLGGHTDTTMVPIVSQARIGGLPLTSLLSQEKIDAIVARTMRGGAEIGELMKVSSAYYAPSAATVEMVEAILLDQDRLIPSAVLCKGEYGIKDIVCGVMCQLGDGRHQADVRDAGQRRRAREDRRRGRRHEGADRAAEGSGCGAEARRVTK